MPKERMTIQAERLTIQVGASPDRPLEIELLPQGGGVRVLGSPPQPLALDVGNNREVVLDFQSLEVRISRAALRSIMEALPPEMLH